MELLHDIWDAVKSHLAVIGLVTTWIVIALVAIRRRMDWKSKRFAGQVNFSINYVADNRLVLRTLLEVPATTVWINEYGVKLVTAAAKKTLPDQPFILLKDPADLKFVQRAVLNVLSEQFSEAFVATAMGLAVEKAIFLFALTFENYADMRTRKFRVLLVEEKSLQAMFGPQAPEFGFVEPIHVDRLKVLQYVARLAAQPKSEVEGVEVLHRVELGIVRRSFRGDSMQLGKVVGHGISTVKHPSLNGWKLLLVQLLTVDGRPDGEPLLAIDSLGAGSGSVVMLTNDGQAARQAVGAKNSPVRWMVLGICER